MSAWLITGGAGFIGSNFLRFTVEHTQNHLVVLDSLTYAGNLANISDLIDTNRVTFIKGDICNISLVTELFNEHAFSHIIHFAAESHVDRSILGPQLFLKTNVEGTYILLEATRTAWKNDYHNKMFLHVSTDEVYGSIGPDEPPFTEKSCYRPNSPYSASKASADHLVRAWHTTFGLPTVITNCSNNYGPWQFPEKLIPLMILNAFESRELPVYGNGLHIRDWLHVEDHCMALQTILERGLVGETYVIGGNNEWTNIAIVHEVCKVVDELTGKSLGSAQKLITHVPDRLGHDRRYALDASKLRRELGWSPRHKFDESLPAVVRWYLEHQDWANAIRSGEYAEFYHRQYGSY